jgi:hypothetical protein
VTGASDGKENPASCGGPAPEKGMRPGDVLLVVPLEDRLHVVLDREEEAGLHLRAADRVPADVEPHWRVERGHLVEQDVGELGLERVGVLVGGEVATLAAPAPIVPATRVIICLTDCSRVGEPSWARKYFWATMLVAFCDTRRSWTTALTWGSRAADRSSGDEAMTCVGVHGGALSHG